MVLCDFSLKSPRVGYDCVISARADCVIIQMDDCQVPQNLDAWALPPL
jgi:hypothetical protein